MIDHESYLNTTVKDMAPSGIRKFFDLANQIEGVVSLGVGEPDFDTPWHVREAAIYALEKGKTFYTPNPGLLDLRKEICAYQKRKFNLDYQVDQVIVTVGGSEGIDLACRSLLNPGDEVILPIPSYVAYSPAIALSGGVVKYIELKEENDFKLTPDMLNAVITDRTKMLLLNYPNNPTGGTMSREDFAKIVPIIKEHGIVVVSDEIYAELCYDEKFCSIASFDEIKDQVVLISGFSKAYAMTGWRLGYLLAHPTFIKAMNKVHQYVIMCANTMAQYAGIEALKNGDEGIEQMRLSYLSRRNYLVEGLNRLGLKTFLPRGAFYVFPCIKSTGLTSKQFCELLLAEEKCACVPGDAFGEAGEGYVRISYAYSIEQLKDGLGRIENFLRKLKDGKVKV